MANMKNSNIPWIGEIPEGWEVKELSFIFEEHKEKNKLGSEDNVLSLSYGKIVKRNVDSNMGLLPESFNTYNIVKPNDIVLRLTDLQNDKKSLRTGLVTQKGIITSAYLTLRAKTSISSVYYHYLLHTYDIMKIIYNMGEGVRQNLKYSELAKMPLLALSINKQQKIADYLDNKTALIEERINIEKEQITKLKEYRKSLISEAVTKGLDKNVKLKDSGIEWIGEIPEGWEVRKLKHIGTIKSGDSLNSEEQTEKGNYEVWGANGLIGYSNEWNIDLPKIIIGRVGACGSINFSLGKRFISDNALILSLLEEKSYNYYRYVLIVANLSNLNTSNAQPLITGGKVLNFSVPYPILAEQQKIADYLDAKTSEIDKAISQKEMLIEKLGEYKKSLIYEFVTGKMEV